MSNVRVKINFRGVAETKQSAGVLGLLQESADKIAARAQANAVVLDKHSASFYANGVRPKAFAVRGRAGAVGKVYANAPFAMRVEAKYGILARALGG